MSGRRLPRTAARCRFVRMTLDREYGEGVRNLCQHVVREGRDCVGPFLDEWETDCGLWELRADAQPTPTVGEPPGRRRA